VAKGETVKVVEGRETAEMVGVGEGNKIREVH
jgi:hypothetical protein